MNYDRNTVFIISVLIAMAIAAISTPVWCQDYAGIIAPSHVRSGISFPVVVFARSSDETIVDSYAAMSSLILHSPQTAAHDLSFRKGAAYKVLTLDAPASYQVSVEGLSGSAAINISDSTPVIQHTDDIMQTNETWGKSAIHVISATFDISVGAELTIEAGTLVLLEENCSLTVNGTLRVAGTEQEPVLFAAEDTSRPWGGILVRGTGEFRHGLFIGGGGDASKSVGHSQSQPVLYAEYTEMSLDHCYIIDNPGKAIAGRESVISVDSCVIAQCDTGGEIINGVVTITSSYIMDIPDSTSTTIDDDNDGFYFNSAPVMFGLESVVEQSYILGTKDDGLDQNSAPLTVRDCWIEGCDHEGIAASNANHANIYNTVVRDCEQGIEAGYGSPEISVDHCLVFDNDIGLRFGDSYDWGCSGSITVTNSMFFDNGDNIWNFDRKTQGPVENAITISYSMTNDSEYDNEPFCIIGTPVFDDRYFLASGSPGKEAGSNGFDMGLVRTDTVSGLVINELLALNDNLYCDDFGDFDDWVELYNGSGQPIDIGGMYVSDDAENPRKCQIPTDDSPATTIEAGGFLILWLDGETEQGPLHLDTRLRGAGEQLTVYSQDGTTPVDGITFGQQQDNVSYGRASDGGMAWRIFTTPTPGLSNSIAENPAVPEYYITCDQADFERMYANYKEDILIPITIEHGSRVWDDVQMRIRGETSRRYPKKSLRVEFDSAPFSDGRNTLIFNAEYYDKTYMHQYISSLMFKEAGVPCFGAEHVRLYLNGEYLGLYLRLDSMDEDFLEAVGLDPDGDLYKAAARGACLSIYDDISVHWDKKTSVDSGYDSLRELIDRINTVPDEEYYAFASEQFDYPRMVDVLALNMLLINASTYYHNYYMYKDMNHTEKWLMLPWDLDKTLSSYSWSYPYHASAWTQFLSPDNPLLERAIICDPIFQDIQDRIDELHDTVFNRTYVSSLVDSLKTLIRSSVDEDETDDIADLDEWEELLATNLSFIEYRYEILKQQFAQMPRTFSLVRPDAPFDDSGTLSWRPSEDPDGGTIEYTLKYSSGVDFPDSATTTITALTDTSYTFTDLPPDGMYYWVVYADDGTYSVEGFDSRSTFTVMRSTILPPVIAENMMLTQEDSPYISSGDVVIASGVTVTAEPGTVIRMAESASIIVEGAFISDGSSDHPITITTLVSGNRWGALCFMNEQVPSVLSHVVIENASEYSGISECIGAVSGLHATIDVSKVEFNDCNGGISVHGGDVTVSDCVFRMNNTGEQISVKNAHFECYDCTIEGSDSDAIDLGGVNGAVISGCIIRSSGDDGIDVGDQSTEIAIENVRIAGCADKGISIGQSSSASIFKSLIVDSPIGVAIFDGSHADIDRTTLVDHDTALSLYRRNEEDTGGSVDVRNSILYNSATASYAADASSTVQFRYCISDAEKLKGVGNLYGMPGFNDPANGDYRLVSDSPCVDAGDPGDSDPDGSRADIGAFYFQVYALVINEINYNSSPLFDSGDWIELVNSSVHAVDISGWVLKDADDAHVFTFPDAEIEAEGFLVVSNDLASFGERYPDVKNVLGPFGFGLSGSGDTIRLYDETGTPIDSLSYMDAAPWPTTPDGNGATLSLVNPLLDNTVATNWEASKGNGTPGQQNDVYREYHGADTYLAKPFRLQPNYPNPFSGSTLIPVTILERCRIRIELYSTIGQKLATVYDGYLDKGTHGILFESGRYASGRYIYHVRAGDYNQSAMMILMK